ncbi:hypothetical protein NC653_028826 [Populus alba x Populus x berolinensis]|uniref:Uncharacterized protein n=1 Tax=Populus alba x Populus x berolinensis TaxID=444605 RepID=A0AAD6Q3T2_9ROSI|nr:hypothetical protein NC653_028826 [Populus alba x Populus x berolinensis]
MEGRPVRMTGIAEDKTADKMICDQGRRSWLQLGLDGIGGRDSTVEWLVLLEAGLRPCPPVFMPKVLFSEST